MPTDQEMKQMLAMTRDIYGDVIAKRDAEIDRLRTALESIKGFGHVNLSSEWEHGLRDIIRSMTDCARDALHRQNEEKR